MINIYKRCLFILIISMSSSCLFAQIQKNMADSDLYFEKLDLMTNGSNENLYTKYGDTAKTIRTGNLEEDWYIDDVDSNKSLFTRTKKGFILERKIKYDESWQGAPESPRFIVHPKKKYKVSFNAKASEPVTVVLALNRKSPPWDNVGLWQQVPLQKEFKHYSYTFTVPTDIYCGFSLMDVGLLTDITIELEDYQFEEIK